MLYNEGGETLAQVVQRFGKCPTLGKVRMGWALSNQM